MTPRDPELAPFPPEDGWLRLSPPPISTDFVTRTMQRLHAELPGPTSEPSAAHEAESSPVEALLAHYVVPAPSVDFVERTTARVQQEQRSHWRALLARYVVPPATAEFVERTLAALRGEQVRIDQDDLPSDRGRVEQDAPSEGWGRQHQADWRLRLVRPLLAAAAVLAGALWWAGVFDGAGDLGPADAPALLASQLGNDSPLPAVFARLAIERDPDALPWSTATDFGIGAAALLPRRSPR